MSKPVGSVTQLTGSPGSPSRVHVDDKPSEPEEEPEEHFGLSDILRIPQPQATTETRAFWIPGKEKELRIKISTEAKFRAEKMFDLMAVMAKAAEETENGEKPVVINCPPPIRRLEIRNHAYLGMVRLLAAVAVAPCLKWQEWAMLGHQMSLKEFDPILAWAASANGVTEFLVAKAMEQAGNASSLAAISDLSDSASSQSV